ncbi:hypothetical protein P7K49_026977 [Saguinus oedipus]|uniref:Golgin subfamily A conserved domain-containing protein n=1 Tax=Saguinus oedipus TaxID=9490 RepID=A0ABQ9UET0_SAGOE|nr:hypothetical protein P7K49_026977 [Saguinus oedipus]
MEKLQSHFMELIQEKMDLKEQAEKRMSQYPAVWRDRHHQKHITLYQSQRPVLKLWPRKKYIRRLAQDNEEMKVKLLELLELVLRLVGDGNKWHSKFLAAAQNPADESAPGAPALGDRCQMRLAHRLEPAQVEVREGSTP